MRVVRECCHSLNLIEKQTHKPTNTQKRTKTHACEGYVIILRFMDTHLQESMNVYAYDVSFNLKWRCWFDVSIDDGSLIHSHSYGIVGVFFFFFFHYCFNSLSLLYLKRLHSYE